MRWYHGTTKENLRSLARGLRKGTWVSPDDWVARFFAWRRALWNGETPVVLLGESKTTKTRKDRKGNRECQLLTNASWTEE